MTSAPASSSASVWVRGAARETMTISGTSGASATRFEVSGRRAVASKIDAARLARLGVDLAHARGQLRVVGERGADADRDRVDRRAPAVGALAARRRR